MSVYARIAQRYGVDSLDDEAVDEFFLKTAVALPEAERRGILSELLDSSSHAADPIAVAATKNVNSALELLSIDDAPPVPLPPNALHPTKGAAETGPVNTQWHVTQMFEERVTEAVTKLYRVEKHAACPSLGEKFLEEAHTRTLILLLMKLKFIAGDIDSDESGIRVIAFTKTVMLKDGTELAPLSIYFRMSEDGKVAQIVNVERIIEPTDVIVSGVDLIDVLVNRRQPQHGNLIVWKHEGASRT